MRSEVLMRVVRMAGAALFACVISVISLSSLRVHAAWTGVAPGLEALAVSGRPTLLALPGAGSNATALPSAPRILAAGVESPEGLSVVNPDAGTIQGTLSFSVKPIALAVDSAGGRAYVLGDEGRFFVVEIAARALAASFRIQGEPKALLVRESAGRVAEVLVSQQEPNQLAGIDPASGAVLRTVALPAAPLKLAWAGNGSRVLVTTRGGRILVLDGGTLQLLATIQTGGEIRDIAWWEAGNVAMVLHERNENASLIDIATGQTVGAAALGDDPERVSVDPTGGRAYVAMREDAGLGRVNLARRVFEGHYVLPEKAAGSIFDVATGKLLISQRGERRLLRLDPDQASRISVLPVKQRLRDVAVNNTTHEAVAVSDKADELARIRLTDRSVQTLALPARPRSVVVDPHLNVAVVGLKNKEVRFVELSGAAPMLLAGTVRLSDESDALAVDSTRSLAVALTGEHRGIHFMDTAARTRLASITYTEAVNALAIHPGKGIAYIVTDHRKLVLVGLESRSVIQTVALPFRANAIAVDETSNAAVFTTDQDNRAYVLDLNTIGNGTSALTAASFSQSHALPRAPGAVAMQPDTRVAVIASKESDTLSYVDLGGGTATAGFAILEKPFALSISSRYNQALVLSEEKDQIAFVPLANPAPVLESLSPAEAPVDGASRVLGLGGRHFVEGSIAYFGPTALATRWLSHTQLEADVPASLLAAAAAVQVAVRNPPPAGGASNALTFNVLAPPVLSAVTPGSALADGQPKMLTLIGQNFRVGATVLFGTATLEATFQSATGLTVTVPATQTPGVVQIAVVNPGAQISNNLPFSFTHNLAITSFTPASGPVGTAVAITGIGFDPVTGNNQIRFNGEPAVIVSGNATTLNAIVPLKAVTGPISIINSRGTASSATPFTVQEREAFDITLAPAMVQAPPGGNGATKVTLTSTGLNPYPNAASLVVTGLPAGVTAALSRPSVFLGGDSIVTFTAAAGVAAGAFPVTITAIGQAGLTTLTKTKTLTLEVLAAGGTTITGRVLHADDSAPFAGARVRLGATHVFTDATGTYRFVNPPVLGDQVLLIDGNTANTPTAEFPSGIAMPALIVAGQDNKVLTSFIGKVDPSKFTNIVPGQTASVTTLDIANFSLNIPQGATLIGWDGQPIDKINVRTVSVDRLPIRPIPEGVETRSVYLYYFFREGGANPTQPIPVTMANDIDALPGEQVTLWYYDESPTPDANSNQWRVMGLGTVSADGKTIVSNPGVGIPKFCCGASFIQRGAGGNTGGNAGNGCGPQSPNPVDLGSGNAMVFRPRPFGISKLMSVDPNCQYRSTDVRVGLFGRGMNFTYDWFAETAGTEAVRVTNPQGAQFMLSREVDGVFRARSGRSAAIEMEVTPTATGRTLRLADGTQYEFDTRGRLTAIKDLAGNRTTFQLSAQGFPQSMTDASGKVYQFQTTGAPPIVTRITDPAGRFVQFDYDASRRLIRYTDQGGGVTQLEYDAANRISRMTDPRGAVKTIEYDAAGRAVREVLPENAEERYAYTAAGGTVAETRYTDANGNVTTHRFNGLGFPTQVTDALGRVTRSELDSTTNLVKRSTDPAGRMTQFTYNQRGDLIRVIDPAGNPTLIEYDLRFRKPVRIENALGHVVSMEYNNQGSLSKITNAENEITTFTYTAKGQLETVADALNRVSRFTYDSNGNLIDSMNAAGETVSRAYDLANRLVEVTDALNRTNRLTYDALDRVTEVRDAALGLTRYAYDANDNLTSATDQNNNPVERNVYDLRNRLTQKTDAKNLSSAYQYDGVGNLTRATDRKGQATNYTYDAVNRITQVTDADGRTTSYGYDLAGNLTRISDSQSGDMLMSYDTLNRLVEVVSPQGTVQYAYDAIGRRTSRTLSGGDVTAYTYDKANRVKTITLMGKTASYGHDAAGRLVSKTLPNGIRVAYQYDAVDRVTSIAYTKADNTPIETISYTYDASGQRTQKALGGTALRETPFTANYDAANRLIALTLNGEAFTLTYDNNGNLVSKTGPTSGATTYTWDARNRLAQISGAGVTAQFRYDAMGRRIEKTVNGATTGFLYDGAQAIAELRSNTLDTVYHTGLQIDEVLARYGASG
ncbi:MAG: IPT/TIG domain-containing protein, partial [Burkholderiales bacterium]